MLWEGHAVGSFAHFSLAAVPLLTSLTPLLTALQDHINFHYKHLAAKAAADSSAAPLVDNSMFDFDPTKTTGQASRTLA
jgi:hypothetical protein